MPLRPLTRALMAAALLYAAVTLAAAQKTTAPPVRGEMLVTTTWLAKQLNNPKDVILHAAAARQHYDSARGIRI
jgi:hypothetical protein